MFDAAKNGVTIVGKAIATGTTEDAATVVWEKGVSIKVYPLATIKIG